MYALGKTPSNRIIALVGSVRDPLMFEIALIVCLCACEGTTIQECDYVEVGYSTTL